ncbi:hypothetical protein DNU06_10095 [Putridiphycobacter roseus]|uniref:Uncharacterized protein n=2 Tax=Putridiphycobacter roseus TaxID=2219161 RepID=A0A2W1NCI9_9FLAO|nr:hypothetical protein DNU06_10095 [Putridiphycobacter roseus]
MKFWGTPFPNKASNNAIIEYNKDINNSKAKFTNSIKSIYPNDNAERKNLINLYEAAVLFRSNKKLRKKLFEIVIQNIGILSLFLTPFLLPILFFKEHFNIWEYILNYLLTILVSLVLVMVLIPLFSFITNFKIKIGRALSGFIKLILLIIACFSIYYFIDLKEGVLKGGILSAYTLFYIILLISSVTYFVHFLVDAVYFTDKIQLSDELIIESAYRLSKVEWNLAIKRRSVRQNTIDEIERLAGLIEKDWSSHILPGDERTDKWKIKTLNGIASSIRAYKRQLIIPSVKTPIELKAQFKNIFEKILKHDIKGLLDAEVPASRIRKKSKFAILHSIIVAALPISAGLIIKNYFPNLMEEGILNIGIAIGALWLLISVLLWLDPNLADKIATIRSFKDVIGSNNSD